MIFVTIGTQDKPFNRLIEEIEKLKEKGVIDNVIIQAGCTKVNSKKIKTYEMCTLDEYNKYMDEADIIITHGGVGSIIDGVSRGKKVIAVPRLQEYGENTNDHQIQIVEEMAKKGYIIGIRKIDKLESSIKGIKNFKPKKYIKNNQRMIDIIQEFIKNN